MRVKTEAIVASAGLGRRLTRPLHAKAGLRKPYLNLLGKPILVHTLQALGNSKDIDSIIVVVNRLDNKRCIRFIKRYKIKKIKTVIAGGRHRFNSVHNGLCVLDKDTDIVLIHDGVRPFIDDGLIRRSINCAKRFGACIVGVPVKATIKKVKTKKAKVKIVEKTIDRKDVWEIQTPQVFKKDLILAAYKKFGGLDITDDSMLAERLGAIVRVIMGSYKNIKITTPEDLVLAREIAKCA